MTCDYCGWATGALAVWEVTTAGTAPGDGMTRYPCDVHLAAACRKVGEVGGVQVLEHNRAYLARRAAA